MTRVDALEVLEPGLLATVQDGGRPELAAEGITRGGAADPWSLAVANLLVGNAPDAAAIELTLPGAAMRALLPVTVALAGTIAGRVGGRPVAPGSSVALGVGDVLEVGGPATGARAYVAAPGGIDVPVVLGSRSTALGAGFGGFNGRALRAGDRLDALADELVVPELHWPGPAAAPPGPVRVLEGASEPPFFDAIDLLVARPWTVAPASDRMGLRLQGTPLPLDNGEAWTEVASIGVVAGTIQVPRDRLPIVLLADHQPTGGYPVVAVAIRADLPRLGQLGPGAVLRFARTSVEEARDALLGERRTFEEALAAMHDAARWDELWQWARA